MITEQYIFDDLGNGTCRCIDTYNGISITWPKGDFNDGQMIDIVNADELARTENAARIAHLINAIAQYLIDEHPETL